MRFNLFQQLAIAVSLCVLEQVSAVADGLLDPRPAKAQAAHPKGFGRLRRLERGPEPAA